MFPERLDEDLIVDFRSRGIGSEMCGCFIPGVHELRNRNAI